MYKYGSVNALVGLLDVVVPFDLVTVGLLFASHQTNVHLPAPEVPVATLFLPLDFCFQRGDDDQLLLLDEVAYAASVEVVRLRVVYWLQSHWFDQLTRVYFRIYIVQDRELFYRLPMESEDRLNEWRLFESQTSLTAAATAGNPAPPPTIDADEDVAEDETGTLPSFDGGFVFVRQRSGGQQHQADGDGEDADDDTDDDRDEYDEEDAGGNNQDGAQDTAANGEMVERPDGRGGVAGDEVSWDVFVANVAATLSGVRVTMHVFSLVLCVCVCVGCALAVKMSFR